MTEPTDSKPRDPARLTSRAERDGAERFRTFAGTIVAGMEVVGEDDKVIGTVKRVEDNRIILETSEEGGPDTVPLGLIDGIGNGRVLLSGRGDASFGMGAQP